MGDASKLGHVQTLVDQEVALRHTKLDPRWIRQYTVTVVRLDPYQVEQMDVAALNPAMAKAKMRHYYSPEWRAVHVVRKR